MAFETDERVAELTDKLESGIMELYASENYAQYISAMTKFHHYSFGNALLIFFQNPGASQVAGYNTWKQLGRQVKRGEKGIMILAPCNFSAYLTLEKLDPKTGKVMLDPDGNPLTEKKPISPNRFKIAHAKLHKPGDILEEVQERKRRQKEVEAESIAYVVCQHFGIETSDYSFAYVAGWSKGQELSELKASLQTIHATAGEIIDAISPPPPKPEREQLREQTRRQSTKSRR